VPKRPDKGLYARSQLFDFGLASAIDRLRKTYAYKVSRETACQGFSASPMFFG